MKKFRKTIAGAVLAIFFVSGCVTTQKTAQNPTGGLAWSSPEACIAGHVAGGAALGAASGAVVGVLSGGSAVKGAVIGAVSGGFASFAYAWGKCFAMFTKIQSEQTKGFSETQSEIGYSSQQGTVVKIGDYFIDPSAIEPGGKSTVNAPFYVMTPEEKDITVTSTMTLKFFDQEKKIFVEAGSTNPDPIVMKPGQGTATSELPIPSSAEEGEFIVVFKIEAMGQTDQKEMPFVITKNQEVLAKAKTDSINRRERAETQPSRVAVASLQANDEKGSKSAGFISGRQILVTVSKANLRENPDVASKIVGSASKDDKYPFLSTVTVSGKEWHQIKLPDGKMAWIRATLAKVVE